MGHSQREPQCAERQRRGHSVEGEVAHKWIPGLSKSQNVQKIPAIIEWPQSWEFRSQYHNGSPSKHISSQAVRYHQVTSNSDPLAHPIQHIPMTPGMEKSISFECQRGKVGIAKYYSLSGTLNQRHGVRVQIHQSSHRFLWHQSRPSGSKQVICRHNDSFTLPPSENTSHSVRYDPHIARQWH
jgi:hypothetical protein